MDGETSTMRLASHTIGTFLANAASTEPAPGAGSSGALALALGIACARKAMAFSLQHHPDRPRLGAVEAHFGGLAEQALAGAEADMQCFTAYIAARRRGPDDEAGREAQRDAVADLLAVGENLVAIADEARGLIEEIREFVIPMMANDIAAALSLIAAARAIHLACVEESRSTTGD